MKTTKEDREKLRVISKRKFTRDILDDIEELEAENEKLKEAVQYLVNGAEMVLEANEEGIECRSDEDCDHCVLVSAIHNAKSAKIMGEK